MKLSQMTSDQAADTYLRIMPDVEVLLQDEELAAILRSRKAPKSVEEANKLGKIVLLRIAGHLLKNRRENVWNLLGTLNDKAPEEIASQLITQTTMQLMEALNDKELIAFFTQVASFVQQM